MGRDDAGPGGEPREVNPRTVAEPNAESVAGDRLPLLVLVVGGGPARGLVPSVLRLVLLVLCRRDGPVLASGPRLGKVG